MDDFMRGSQEKLNNSFHDINLNELGSSTYSFQLIQNFSEDNNTTLWFSHTYQKVLDYVNLTCYLLICILGIIGNSLVIYVVLVYAKMKTVTNMYILNLAFSDVLFLTMLPITATTVIVQHWVFGQVMCKIYFVLCAINTFGSAFNLCVMSADRYLAVCHPISSINYRTPRIACCMCMSVWTLCCLVMTPVIMYATTMKHHTLIGKFSCKLNWPASHVIHPGIAFVWYTFILGFVIPVTLITVFYVMVIFRLRQVAAVKKCESKRRSHGRVTRLIFTVVAVYIICWLPYWSFQVYGTISVSTTRSVGMVLFVNFLTILSYTNSMLNPLLYAFLSENFRTSFFKAFKCIPSFGKTRTVCYDKSMNPGTSESYMRPSTSLAVEERVELSPMDVCEVALREPIQDVICTQVVQDELGCVKPLTDL